MCIVHVTFYITESPPWQQAYDRFNRKKIDSKRFKFYWTDAILMDSQFLYFIGIHFNCGLKRKLFQKHSKYISAIPQKNGVHSSHAFMRSWNLFVLCALEHIGIQINQTANHVNNEHKNSSTMNHRDAMNVYMNEWDFFLFSKRCRKRDISTFMFSTFNKDKKI